MGLSNIVINILGGAFTGYITNDLAVKMIFRRLGPFGGIVLKTKEQFIASLSQLVEREVINGRTLARQTNRREFRELLGGIVDQISAKAHGEVANLASIPGYKESKLGLERIWHRRQKQLAAAIDEALNTDITKEQRELLLKRLEADLLPLFWEAVNPTIHQMGPKVVDLMTNWLKLHRQEIEIMFNEAINETSGQVEKYLKDALFTNPAREIGVVDGVIAYLSSERQKFTQVDPRMWLGSSLFEQVDGFMAKLSIGEKFTQQPLKLLSLLTSKQDFRRSIVNRVYIFMARNLEGLLTGQIERMVATNLNRLNEDQLQRVVEDFMGRELKPINIFGALLGALGACMLVLTGTQSQTLWLAGVFGLIGYLTNYIALKMIFRPYYPIYFLGLRVPFTPGVVAKQQQRFARSMGTFVSERLITGTPLLDNRRHLAQALRAQIIKGLPAQVPNIAKGIIGLAIKKLRRLEFSGGKLGRLIEVYLPQIPILYRQQITNKLSEVIYRELVAQKGILKITLWQKLERKGGLPLRMVTRFLGLEDKLSQVVDLVIDRKLPALLRQYPINYDLLLEDQEVINQAVQNLITHQGFMSSLLQIANDVPKGIKFQQEHFVKVVEALLLDLASQDWLHPSTIGHFDEIVADVINRNMDCILDSVNIRWITEQEVGSMPPERVERLFYSFAGPYLRRVELYGWWGGLVGLAVDRIIKLL